MAEKSTTKVVYIGRAKAWHTSVGGKKYHFLPENNFTQDVREDHARELFGMGQYMPPGSCAARASFARAKRLRGGTEPAAKK